MPATRISSRPLKVPRFSVLGCDQDHDSAPDFIGHVGLAGSDAEVATNERTRIIHMAPPLRPGSKHVSAAAWLELSNTERQKLGTWIEREVAQKRKIKDVRNQYWAHPPVKEQSDEQTGIVRYKRYSCAGFVYEAYKRARVILVDLDKCPLLSKSDLESAFPIIKQESCKYGLEGEDPKRVLMPGYLLHALNRPDDVARSEPYRPRPSDVSFP